MDQGDASDVPGPDPRSLARLEPHALRGSSQSAQESEEPLLRRPIGHRDSPVAQGHAGVERDGHPVETHATRNGGKSGDQSAIDAGQYLIAPSPHDRLRQAGVLSGDFWLTK